MIIEYGSPLSRAMNRMKKALFQPFDLGKWFTLGFAAFLADLMEGHGGGGGNTSKARGNFDIHEIVRFPESAWNWLMDNSGWFALIIFGLVFLFVVLVILTWLSSRGKFIFVSNIAGNEAKIVEPWHEYRKEGNSLFLWRLVFGLISFVIVMSFIVFSFTAVYNMDLGGFGSGFTIFPVMGLVLTGLVIFIVLGYIESFLGNFVVPIMYKERVTATQGWSVFLKLFSSHTGHFILFGLFKFLLNILVLIMVVSFGLFTCCIGFVLLIIPYIGSIVLLPISYTFTAFNLEYLEQFGPEFKLFVDVPVKTS